MQSPIDILENIPLIASVLGGLITFFSIVWMKVFKPLVYFLNHQDKLNNAISDIKHELTTNGGNSLKDSIVDLRKTCHRIEIRQKIIEQRTKAGLHYSNVPLFETDNNGRLIWNNNLFFQFLNSYNVEGYDWLNFITEYDRESVLKEFRSCLNTNRRMQKVVETTDGRAVTITGFPYRISDDEQGGFLVSITENRGE
jgi:hypothetical protein